MFVALLVVQIVILLVLTALLLRKPPTPQPDPRVASLPEQVAQVLAHHAALDASLRAGLGELRRDTGVEAAALRREVLGTLDTLGTTLGAALKTELAAFRMDSRSVAEKLHGDVHTQHEAIAQKLTAAASDARRHQAEAQEALHTRLTQLHATNAEHQEKLRGTVGDSLARLNQDNTAKLEEMRATVDEKLQATLHDRLTRSFGQVTDQLNKVHTGLGEMSKLSEGVDGLSRIFTNVKSRGGFAEVQLGMLLDQMLAPSQFVRNARVKANTQEVVEFAVRFPGHTGETLLPIDAKFPREDWERLESAYAANDPALLNAAGRAFEAAIRTEGKRICEKYINPPLTTPHAIMFLPTEGLYAEVMRRDALQAEIQSKCQVTIAGPSTLSAILTSFQMGFHMLALQAKGDDVWKVLEQTKTEFKTFENLMGSMEKQVGTVQNTLQKLGVRTRAINRNLREVSETPGEAALEFEDVSRGALRLVAEAE